MVSSHATFKDMRYHLSTMEVNTMSWHVVLTALKNYKTKINSKTYF